MADVGSAVPASATLTLQYDAKEDRILAIVNVGQENAPALWLTRQLTLTLLASANSYLDRLSPSVDKTPQALRGELATMERQVALARTRGSLRRTPEEAVDRVRGTATLATQISIGKQGEAYFLRFVRGSGPEVLTLWSREHLQRILVTLDSLVEQAGWRGAPARPGAPEYFPSTRH